MSAKPQPASPKSAPTHREASVAFTGFCPGIHADNPRDFLAALGLLRVLQIHSPESRPSLGWTDEGHANFHALPQLSPNCLEEIVPALQQLNSSQPHPFVHHKVIKTQHASFRTAILRARELCLNGNSLPAALYAAYGSQVHDADKGETSPSAFSFSNGQGGKELLRDINELIDRELTPAQLAHDLAGDRQARKEAKSFRWNPAEFRAAAYRAADPGSGVKGDGSPDHPTLNILAFFGLTFYPVVDGPKFSATAGFSRHKLSSASVDYFSWPIWEESLNADEVGALLLHPVVHAGSFHPPNLRAMGISAIWRSRRFSSDKSLYFSPAERVA